jgi:hypothetical protein
MLSEGQVLVHPWVVGELACGNLQDRKLVLELLQSLPLAPVASAGEVLVTLMCICWLPPAWRERAFGYAIGD